MIRTVQDIPKVWGCHPCRQCWHFFFEFHSFTTWKLKQPFINAWNAKCPIFLGNCTPKTSNFCLKNSALGVPGGWKWLFKEQKHEKERSSGVSGNISKCDAFSVTVVLEPMSYLSKKSCTKSNLQIIFKESPNIIISSGLSLSTFWRIFCSPHQLRCQVSLKFLWAFQSGFNKK